MRNLKKLLAVVLTVVMIASMMVPALAANTYEAEALKLQSIGMFAGEPADLKLEEGVTRIQGLAFAIRAAGKEADAFAMTDEEVATILNGYVDGAAVPAWGRKYAAYAIKNNITVGVSATEKKFDALAPISGTSFLVFLMKSGMGYADVTTATVVEASVNAGILTAGQAAGFGAKAALIRDDAAGILFGAAMNGVNADGTPLILALIASGFVDADAALAAGFVVEAEPEDLEVVDVYAENLKEIVVVFNKELDKDELDKEDFTFSPSVTIDDPILADDNKTVTLFVSGTGKLTNQTKEYSLTVRDVKDTDGDNIAKTVVKFKASDATLPTVKDIVITGPKGFEIIFNEPVDTSVIGNLKIKSSSTTLSAKTLSSSSFDKNKVTVELFTSLADGKDYTIEVSDFKDYAGYTNVLKIHEFTYSKSTSVPVASIEKATQEYVVVKFDKPVKGLAKANFYHSFSAWQPMNIFKNKDDMDANLNPITTSDSVGTVYVKFATDGSTGQYPLQPGDVKVFIKGKVGSVEVKDNWDNKLGDVELVASVVADTTAPEVSNIEVKGPKELKITFTEAIKSAKTSNFTIVDDNGKSISGLGFTVSVSSDSKSVTLNLTKDLTGKTIAITVKDIVDKTINENKMVAYTETLDFGDSEFKGLDRVEYNATEKVLYVVFKEEVNDSAIDIENYRIKVSSGKEYELDGPANFYGSNKVVKIDLSNTEAGYAAAAGSQLVIRNIEDLAGNDTFVITSGISSVGTKAGNDWIRATGKNEIKIQFDQELQTVDAEEFELSINAATGSPVVWKKATGVETQLNDDGTLVILTFEDNITADVNDTEVKVRATFANTENMFGVAPNNIVATSPADYIAPSVIDDGIVTVDSNGDGKIDQIKITFDEALNAAYVSAFTWTVEGRTVTTATLSTAVVTLNLKVNDDVLVDTGATPEVTQVLDVKDLEMNGVLTAEAFNDEEYETADAAAPIIVSAIQTSDTEIVVKLSEEVTENLLVNGTGFTVVDSDGTPNSYAVSAAEFDGDTITLTVADMSAATTDIKLAYATQTDKNEDADGNDLATKVAFVID